MLARLMLILFLASILWSSAAPAPQQSSSTTSAATPPGDTNTVARLSEGEAVRGLRDLAAQQAAAGQFAGAIAIARHGNLVFTEAYGLADREQRIFNTTETRFRIGSMNKMFTAVAILQLVQAGKLKLTAPIGDYIKSYPDKDVASKVTVHHLLTHTGGTGDIFGPQFDAKRLALRTLDDYVALYGERDLAFEPGSRWVYSNYGFLLLGVIVERATGESYYDYVRKHIYEPAGMTDTGSQPESEAVPNRSIGYTRRGAARIDPGTPWLPNTGTLPYRGTSAGGGYSTVTDLQRFAIALLSHKLIDAEHTTLLLTGKVDGPTPGSRYAYGFQERTTGGVRTVGHGGGAPGMNGDLIIHPESGYVIAVLSNLDPPAAARLSQFASNRLPR